MRYYANIIIKKRGFFMNIEQLSVNAIRSLVIDGVNKANSGHPGMALGSAPIVYTLFAKHLISDPTNPNWINRDRFVLSAGHVSMLLYSMLHVAGYKISMDDLKQFRQLESITPGHPELGVTPGVDASAGPLGQGIAQAVGMALAEQSIQALYPEGYRIMDHYTYCLCGDGCLQEGISQEAISFAGKQKLNKLILIYDANNVTLDGALDLSFDEDVKKRFESCHWNVIEVKDGNDISAIDKAIKKAKKSEDKPTLVIVRTIIGYGSINQGLSKVHGSPLGKEDGQRAKDSYGYKYPEFSVPEEVYKHLEKKFALRGKKAYKEWQREFELYQEVHQDAATKFVSVMKNDVSTYVYDQGPTFEAGFNEATRKTSQTLLNILNKSIFNLIGGSADVAASVMTSIKGEVDFTPSSRNGRNINFGIREFAMAAIQNGMLIHGGLRTYAGCFMVFADYLKPAIRMASLSRLPAIYLFSHDSIAVGEDGPTHQPIEQFAMLRSIPDNYLYRPCDANELSMSWRHALLSTDHPSCIILSRQNLPLIEGSRSEDVNRGGYIISKERQDNPQLTLIATGSEVSLCIEVQKRLLMEGIDIRVVSMPCQELFLKQDGAYIKQVLGNSYDRRMVVEMASTFGWHRFAPHVMGIDEYGRSAPANDVINFFKFTPEEVIKRIKEII